MMDKEDIKKLDNLEIFYKVMIAFYIATMITLFLISIIYMYVEMMI